MHDDRSLTPGEIELARSIFGNSVDYARVRMIRRKWWPLHPRNAAMAPTGNIHFHPHGELWSDDFARDTLSKQGLFIHEMTHVWQSQTRGRYYLPLMRHPFCRYRYAFRPDLPFERYGLEQQAEIVRHTFLLRRGYGVAGWPVLASLEPILPFGHT
jgi:hypothetical protein